MVTWAFSLTNWSNLLECHSICNRPRWSLQLCNWYRSYRPEQSHSFDNIVVYGPIQSIRPNRPVYRSAYTTCLSECYNYRRWCRLITNIPPKIPLSGAVLWGLQNPYAKIGKFLTAVYTLWDTDSRLLFRIWSKLVQDKCPKGRVTKKIVLALFGGTQRRFPRIFFLRVRTHYALYVPVFIQIRSGLGEL